MDAVFSDRGNAHISKYLVVIGGWGRGSIMKTQNVRAACDGDVNCLSGEIPGLFSRALE